MTSTGNTASGATKARSLTTHQSDQTPNPYKCTVTRSCMRTMDYQSQLKLLEVDIKDPAKTTRLVQHPIKSTSSVKEPYVKLIDCKNLTYCKCCWLPIIGTITLTQDGVVEYSKDCANTSLVTN